MKQEIAAFASEHALEIKKWFTDDTSDRAGLFGTISYALREDDVQGILVYTLGDVTNSDLAKRPLCLSAFADGDLKIYSVTERLIGGSL
jgi:hypothetical protein